MMHWVIEETPNFVDMSDLIREIDNQQHKITFTKMFSDLPEIPDEPTLFLGSLNMEQTVRSKTNWQPGMFCNLPAFQCTYYCPRFGGLLINKDHIFITFGDLIRRKEWLFNTIGDCDCLFIRPNTGNKIFTGVMIERENWNKDIEYLGKGLIDPECLILAAPPVNIVNEWRLVVADKKVIAHSLYKPTRCDFITKEVLNFAEDVLKFVDYQPDRVWCMDIAETKSGRLGVLEVNSFSSSGLYKCAVKPIVETVSRIVCEEYDNYHRVI